MSNTEIGNARALFPWADRLGSIDDAGDMGKQQFQMRDCFAQELIGELFRFLNGVQRITEKGDSRCPLGEQGFGALMR